LVTEKIDGTNAQILITPKDEPDAIGGDVPLLTLGDMMIFAGSRSRWLSRQADNFGFAKWVEENAEALYGLGVGRHFGEWWGQGIQRGYGLTEKRFSLFNVIRWTEKETPPACCSVVPTLWRGAFEDLDADGLIGQLQANGSAASEGFMKPEGIVIYHIAGNVAFKKTIEKDQQPKGLQTK
jgi:hypothetical protein